MPEQRNHKTLSLNKVMIAGRITSDLELKHTPQGAAVTSFSIAATRRYKKGEEWAEETTFIPIVAWGATAESICKNGLKGMDVYVEGRISVRKYTTQDNINKTATEIVADVIHTLEWKPKAEDTSTQTTTTEQYPDDMPF